MLALSPVVTNIYGAIGKKGAAFWGEEVRNRGYALPSTHQMLHSSSNAY